jgi:hypothetical protein
LIYLFDLVSLISWLSSLRKLHSEWQNAKSQPIT